MTETESTDPNMHKKTNYITERLFFHITSKVRLWGFISLIHKSNKNVHAIKLRLWGSTL